MLYSFNKAVVKHFRRDDHEWKTRANSSAVQEHHEKLKIDGSPVINCTYVRHKTITTFHRRVYQRLGANGQTSNADSTVIVHYLDTAATPQEQAAIGRHLSDPDNPPMNHPVFVRQLALDHAHITGQGNGHGPTVSPPNAAHGNGVHTAHTNGTHAGINGISNGPSPKTNFEPHPLTNGTDFSSAPREPQTPIAFQLGRGDKVVPPPMVVDTNGRDDTTMAGGVSDPLAEFLFPPEAGGGTSTITMSMDTSGDDVNPFQAGVGTLSPLEHQLFNDFPSLQSPSPLASGLNTNVVPTSRDSVMDDMGKHEGVPGAGAVRRKSTGSTGSRSSLKNQRKTSHSGVVTSKGSNGKGKSKSSGLKGTVSPRGSHILVSVTDVCPSWDTTAGGSKVLITSPHVSVGHTYTVAFGTLEVRAETVMNGVVRCFAPPHSVGTVALRIKSSSSNIVQINDVSFEYRANDNDNSLTALFQSMSDHEFQARLLDRVERLERAVGYLPNLPSALGAIDFSANADKELLEVYGLSAAPTTQTTGSGARAGVVRAGVMAAPGVTGSVPTVGSGSTDAFRRVSTEHGPHQRRLSLKEQHELPKRLSSLIVTSLDKAHKSHPVLVDLVLNSKDSRGLSMAHILAALGDSYTIAMRACVGFGLNLGLTDVNGRTPLDWAKSRFQHGMEEVLRTGLGQPAAAAIRKLQQCFRNRKKKKQAAAKILTAFRRHKQKTQAAARIQNVFRSHRKHRAATKIQAVFKGHRVRGVAKPGVGYTEQWRAASKIQNAYRNHQVLDRNMGDLELLTINSVISDASGFATDDIGSDHVSEEGEGSQEEEEEEDDNDGYSEAAKMDVDA